MHIVKHISGRSLYIVRRSYKDIEGICRFSFSACTCETKQESAALTEKLLSRTSSRVSRLSQEDVSEDFPSDYEEKLRAEYIRKKRNQALRRFQPKIASENNSVVLFPGQGSQYVGMGETLLQYPEVSKLFKRAQAVLGYDLLKLCLHGPEEDLRKTEHCQPAVMVHSLAAVQKLKHENPKAIENCVTTCGFSVGEYTALVFTGALEFEEALGVVKKRAEAMQRAAEEIPSAMLTVHTGAKSKLGFAMETARKYCRERLHMEDVVLEVANYLFTQCKVVAGHEEAVNFLERNAEDFGLRVQRVPVSGAFHTRLMTSAMEVVKEALEAVDLRRPVVPTHANVHAKPYGPTHAMQRHLVRQVVKPVMWEQTMHNVYTRAEGEEFPDTYEVGPGRQLGAMLRKTNMKAFKQYHSVDG